MSNYEEKYKEALDKAKRYDEVFNTAKEWYNNPNSSNIGKSYLYAVFPELKENEDEKIRKGLIKAFGSIGRKEWGGVNVKNAIAWLEKQKEFVSADFDDVWETADCDELTAPLEKYSKDAIKKMCHAWYDKGIELERRNWLEKQGEQKPQGKTALEAINEEKVDNQFCVKPVDKVESKFKIGDWVFSSVLGTARIIGVNDSNEYQLEYIDGKQKFSSIDYVNYAYDKWNLQYVKNGDVLYSPEHKLLWIYKNKEEYHASINLNCANFISICAYIVIPSDVCPATKEQRDVLEKTMTKVGYKWNSEKKELEIIDWSKHIKYEPNCPSIAEKKSTWSEEDKERIKNILSFLDAQVYWDAATMEKIKPYQKEIDWLKSIKDRVSCEANCATTKWSNKDENIRQWIISDIKNLYSLNKKSGFIVDKEIDWLKSIKDRVGCTKEWKPSDEQIKHLTYVVYEAKHKDSIYTNGYKPYTHLFTLLMQLKKLKG